MTASAAGRRLGQTRQAIDTAIREGRAPGFKSTLDQHVYVAAEYVEKREEREDRETRRLGDRVEALEQQLTELRSVTKSHAAAENAALRDAMVMALAAADERALAVEAAGKAERKLKAYRRLNSEANKHAGAAERLYREALQTLNLPLYPPDDEAT